MCAINFDNFRTDPGQLLSGKHRKPTQKGKANKEHINSVTGKQGKSEKITGNDFANLNRRIPWKPSLHHQSRLDCGMWGHA